MSLCSTTPSSTPRRPPGWVAKVRVVVVANLVVMTGLLVAAEAAARVAVWAWAVPLTFQSEPFQVFGQTDPLVWWKLRPNLDVRLTGVRVRTNRLGFRDERDAPPRGCVRVYCVGDSSTFGWGVEASAMYTAVTERILNAERARDVCVVSTGVPGYTSYQCLNQFREQVAPLQPDWVVIMASNNECRARNLGDRERGTLLARKQAVQRWLGFSRLWVLLSRAPQALSRSWDLNPKPGRVANTTGEYQENIRDLIKAARAVGCRVLVMNVPIRLRLNTTWRHYDRTSPEVAALVRQAELVAEAGGPLDQQAALLAEAIRLQPRQFRAHWLRALLAAREGNGDLATIELALAREGDLHPETSKPSYNRAIERICSEEHVPLVDLDRLFHDSGQSEDVLFLDHCHPSAAGHELIGRALARQLGPLLDRP